MGGVNTVIASQPRKATRVGGTNRRLKSSRRLARMTAGAKRAMLDQRGLRISGIESELEIKEGRLLPAINHSYAENEQRRHCKTAARPPTMFDLETSAHHLAQD